MTHHPPKCLTTPSSYSKGNVPSWRHEAEAKGKAGHEKQGELVWRRVSWLLAASCHKQEVAWLEQHYKSLVQPLERT